MNRIDRQGRLSVMGRLTLARLQPLPGRWRAGVAAGLVLAAAFILSTATGRAVPSALAPTAAESELLAIHAGLNDLRHEFIRPVSVADALTAAWSGAVAAAKQSGGDTDGVAGPRLNVDADTATRNFDAAYLRLSRRVEGKVDPRVFGHAAVAGLASSVHESHTYFIEPARWTHRADTSSRYGGIGVTLVSRAGAFYTGEIFSGSPAAAAGLRPGDRLAVIDDAPVSGMSLDQVVKALRGTPGTGVRVTFERGGGSVQAALIRQWVVIPAFESRILEGGVGYIRLRSFPPAGAPLPGGATIGATLDATLAEFERAGVTAWVLDLRDNPGGYLDGMSEVASRLLPAGTTVFVSRTAAGNTPTRTSSGPQGPDRPLSVLVNKGSASASELITAALQEHSRATIVGEQTAGVANAANLDALPDGGGLSVTSVLSLTPVQLRPLEGQGVSPDVAIAANTGDVPDPVDRQLERAAAAALAQHATAGR